MAAVHDAVTVAGPTVGTSLTWSHTNGAGVPTNGTLLVYGKVIHTSDIVTAITYNGIAPAQTVKASASTLSAWKYVWRFPSPASGAHNVVITTSVSAELSGDAWSFTAAAQGDLSVIIGGSSPSSTNFVVSVDTIINDCVVGLFAGNSVGVPTGVGATNTARSLTNYRAAVTQVTAVVATPAQKYPSFTIGTAAAWSGYAFAIGPYVAPGGGTAAPSTYYARRRRG